MAPQFTTFLKWEAEQKVYEFACLPNTNLYKPEHGVQDALKWAGKNPSSGEEEEQGINMELRQAKNLVMEHCSATGKF